MSTDSRDGVSCDCVAFCWMVAEGFLSLLCRRFADWWAKQQNKDPSIQKIDFMNMQTWWTNFYYCQIWLLFAMCKWLRARKFSQRTKWKPYTLTVHTHSNRHTHTHTLPLTYSPPPSSSISISASQSPNLFGSLSFSLFLSMWKSKSQKVN